MKRGLLTYILLIKLEETALRDDFSAPVTVHEGNQSSSVQWQCVMIESSDTTLSQANSGEAAEKLTSDGDRWG